MLGTGLPGCRSPLQRPARECGRPTGLGTSVLLVVGVLAGRQRQVLSTWRRPASVAAGVPQSLADGWGLAVACRGGAGGFLGGLNLCVGFGVEFPPMLRAQPVSP